MADLVTRLLLNSSQFDNNIRQSTQQVKQFQEVGKNITATIGKLAGALGLAMGAQEAFDRVIKSSQTTSDAYDQSMRALNITVDSFFTAIGTGDFTAFNIGLSKMIQKAKEAQQALDKLGNATMSYSYFDSKYSAELEDAINKAKDLKLSKAERDKAKQTAEAIIGKQTEITQELSKSINSALNSVITEGNALSSSMVNKVDLEEVLLLDITAKGEENKKKLEQQYKEYMKLYDNIIRKHTTYSTMNTSAGAMTTSTVDYSKVNKEMQQYNQQYKQAILYNEILVKRGDDWLQNTIQMAQQLDNSNKKLTEMKNKMQELSNQEVSNIQIIPVGSLVELEKQISAKKTELGLAISNEDRIKINAELTELTEKKRIIEFQYKFPKAPSKLEDTGGTSPLGMIQGASIPDKLPLQIKPEDVQTNMDYAESLGAIASIMGAVTNMTSDSAAAWLSWSANLLSAIATAIPAIETLVAAKTAEAGAEAAAGAAKTPVVGWLLAGAAVASVLAAIATLPKFSEGGIFTGNSTIGDMNLARVNAGEMILNNRQQKNLFNMLNGEGGRTRSGSSEVSFKIKGTDLIGVLNNTNNRLKRL